MDRKNAGPQLKMKTRLQYEKIPFSVPFSVLPFWLCPEYDQ
jgi:hypothetical protein